MSKRPPRSTAEWTTFGISVLILAGVLAAIGMQAVRTDDPPMPVAVIDGPIERQSNLFHVPVTVTNRGDETAEAVQVLVSLDVEGEVIESDQSVDFLSGGDSHELVFVFDDDPAAGELTVRVGGFLVP